MTRTILVPLVCAGLLAACGKNSDNNTTSNNTTVNNTTVNNTTANNTTSNNTTSNNTTVNNTTVNNGPGYTAHQFACNDVTPIGTFADIYGTWEVTDWCVGSDPFEPLYTLCEGAVVTSYEVTDTSGFALLGESYIFNVTATGEAEVYMPGVCTAQIGGGDCAAVAGVLLAAAEAAGATGTASCADDPAGGCYCTLVGQATQRGVGRAENPEPGVAILREFDSDGMPAAYDWQFQYDGTTLIWKTVDSGSTWTSVAGTPATPCETYCGGFLANCNDVDGVVGYDSWEECLTTCDGFSTAGGADPVGNTFGCRLSHMFDSADTSDAANQANLCPPAQATPTAPCVD